MAIHDNAFLAGLLDSVHLQSMRAHIVTGKHWWQTRYWTFSVMDQADTSSPFSKITWLNPILIADCDVRVFTALLNAVSSAVSTPPRSR